VASILCLVVALRRPRARWAALLANGSFLTTTGILIVVWPGIS
jgi:hypothetical protein